jgi:hypothetical protein
MKKAIVFVFLLVQIKVFAEFTLGTPNKTCPNGQITLSFNSTQTFTVGVSSFICIVSDPSGSFGSSQSVVAILNGNNFIIQTLPNNLPASGNYRIKIQASNPSVLSTQSGSFEVVSFPEIPLISPIYANSAPLEVCMGVPTTFNVTNVQENVSYKWGWNFGFLDNLGNSLVLANNVGGSFNYWVEAYKTGTESVCSGIRSDYSYLKVVDLNPYANTLPDASFTQCPGGDALISYAPVFGADTYTYQWLIEGAAISGETNSTFNPMVSGLYSLKISKSGCSGISQEIGVTFSGMPISANFTTPLPNNVMCLNTTLSANSITGATYEWQRYGTTEYSGLNFSPTQVFQVGDYKLKVTKGACVATRDFKLLPPPDEVLFYATQNNLVAGVPINLVVDILNIESGNWSYRIDDCSSTLYNITNTNNVGVFSVSPTANSTTYYLTNVSNVCGVAATSKSVTVSTAAPPVLTLPSLLGSCSSLRVFSATSFLNSSTRISPGSRVIFESSGGVLLNPGFVSEGSVFEARSIP